MKIRTRKRCCTVEAHDGSTFDEDFNRIMEQLPENVELVWDGEMRVHLIYDETVKEHESIEDEYRDKGISLTCEDCPYFERFVKRDGTPDERKKVGGCPFSHSGIAYKDSAACETLYNAIQNREVKLCVK